MRERMTDEEFRDILKQRIETALAPYLGKPIRDIANEEISKVVSIERIALRLEDEHFLAEALARHVANLVWDNKHLPWPLLQAKIAEFIEDMQNGPRI